MKSQKQSQAHRTRQSKQQMRRLREKKKNKAEVRKKPAIPYKQRERMRQAERRKIELIKIQEAEATKAYRDKHKEYQECERNRLANLRKLSEFREKEALTQKKRRDDSEEYRKNYREDNGEYRLAEKIRVCKLRANPIYRQAERLADRRKKKIMRYDRFKRSLLNRKARVGMRKTRNSNVITARKRALRLQKNAITRQTAQHRLRKQLSRTKTAPSENDIFKLRRNFQLYLREQAQAHSNSLVIRQKVKNIDNFIAERGDTPMYICICCERLFFYHSVVRATQEEIDELAPDNSRFSTLYICKTCRQQWRKDATKLPTLAVKNGLQFPDLPNCLKNLTPLEARFVSPYINFMQIRDLTPFALNPQLGIKGSVINIPISVPEMVDVLPRSADNMQTIQLKLKRRLEHTSNYMFETISPKSIYEALVFLVQQELYKKHNITVDEKIMEEYANSTQSMDFIIDSDDENALEEAAATVAAFATTKTSNSKTNDDADNSDSMCELTFPKIYAGGTFNTNSVSYTNRVKSELRRADRRSCDPDHVLYMAKEKQERQCLSNINVCLRKVKGLENMTAGNFLKEDTVNNLVSHDASYRILSQIRSSPAYWETKKKELMALLRQLGKPVFFLTLTANEKRCPELLQLLYQYHYNKEITLEEAMELPDDVKTEKIRKDPCIVEFQMRGSPHEHIIIWLDGAPFLDMDNLEESEKECIKFIDKFITCKNDESIPVISQQNHKHTSTCYKKKGKRKKCRFGIPLPVMKGTRILHPLKEEEELEKEKGKENYAKIKKHMQALYKKPVYVSFDDILKEMGLTENEYIFAIRSSLNKSKVFLKRCSCDVGTNAYNYDILHMFESNMDIQFILNEYAVASYIVNYISKVDSGLSKLLRQAVADTNAGNVSLREKFRKVSNAFINGLLLSAQEAAYLCLSMPLSKSSVDVVFINTGPHESRVRMLKSKKQLKAMNADDSNCTVPDAFDRYERRQGNDDVCLADFVAAYKEVTQNDGSIKMVLRQQPKVIRYVRYSHKQDPTNFFREQCLLFLPWRSEQTDIEGQNYQQFYEQNRNIIRENQKRYVTISDEEIDELFKNVVPGDDDFDEDDEYNMEYINEQDEPVDILAQGGLVKPKSKETSNRYFCPQKFPKNEILPMLEVLNSKQRLFVMEILKRLKCEYTPFNIFLSGAAGVGKSTVINAIYQLASHHFDNIHGINPDSLKVLLAAFSGKAACIIGGTTLHTAFALPINQFGGDLPTLSNNIANTIRAQLVHLKLMIIDEISMVGSKILHWIHQRLVQIFGKNEPFGGISVIVVGDLHQLPPVGDQKVFKPFRNPNNNRIGSLLGPVSVLWENFEYFELSQVMRQKDDINFVNALNHLVIGQMTANDIQLIKSREVTDQNVPTDAIRLFWSNADVNFYNVKRIEQMTGDLIKHRALDNICGKISAASKKKRLETMSNMSRHQTYGLPYDLDLKIGIRYMVTVNIDVEDGLVNGATGTLGYIQCDNNKESGEKTAKVLYIEFDYERTGQKAKREHTHNLGTAIDDKWVPIKPISREISTTKNASIQCYRKQFPITPAEALTIHKGQGSTYESVCVSLKKSLPRDLLYVALSRVTKLNSLYIIGKFKAPPPPSKNNDTMIEINRLKTQMAMRCCFNPLEEKSGLTFGYHNTSSFVKHKQHIRNDDWYRRCDVLVLAETRTMPSNDIEIPEFEIVDRFDVVRTSKTRGIVIYAKPDMVTNKSITYIHGDVKYDSQIGYHSEIYAYDVNGTCLITGYKSPKTPIDIFKNQIYEAWDVAKSCEEHILMGDFNFDILGSSGSNFIKLMDKFNMKNKLGAEEVTTTNNTQIDIVFSDFECIAGSYESYFSDHKPIYGMLFDVNTTTEQRLKLKAQWATTNLIKNITMKGKLLPAQLPSKSSAKNQVPVRRSTRRDTAQNVIQNVVLPLLPPPPQRSSASPIVISGEQVGVDQARAAVQDARAEERRQSCLRIRSQHIHLTTDEMDEFIKVVNQTMGNHMISVILAQTPLLYERQDHLMNDIQIVYVGPLTRNPNRVIIGHYICVNYDAMNQIVYIYDSLYRGDSPFEADDLTSHFQQNHISIRTRQIINIRYPNHRQRIFVKPATNQPDSISCGVFACANATSLLLNQDPSQYLLRLTTSRDPTSTDSTTDLRYHLADIIETGQLSLFPSLPPQ
ncbi:uncharacterized protein LOC116349612 [Contarinia nasturtii]|uniref:uncharacterized protein LOC116349612 n=1 Tax=Contarinia nasturtii TaxID=265458 RepID=UPI0012D3E366|nr:uncharacterized protein LOC116349612 [Contarinia nasturtii]